MSRLSLSTIQRAERGDKIRETSLRRIAEVLNVTLEDLESSGPSIEAVKSPGSYRFAEHRAGQLIIFCTTFFVFVSHWLSYYYQLNSIGRNVSLGDVLTIVLKISVVLATFTWLFHSAKTIYVWGYYFTTGMFLLVAIALSYWNSDLDQSSRPSVFFPVYFTLMTSALLVFHVLQISTSLSGDYSSNSKLGDFNSVIRSKFQRVSN